MKVKPPIRAIIDTNLWISFLIGKQLKSLKPLLVNQSIQPVFTTQLIDEIKIVTQRPKLQKYFKIGKVQELLKFLEIIGFFVEITSNVTICRDPIYYFLALVLVSLWHLLFVLLWLYILVHLYTSQI
jgi:putative PIN family toxin of toxin-antitoxin system